MSLAAAATGKKTKGPSGQRHSIRTAVSEDHGGISRLTWRAALPVWTAAKPFTHPGACETAGRPLTPGGRVCLRTPPHAVSPSTFTSAHAFPLSTRVASRHTWECCDCETGKERQRGRASPSPATGRRPLQHKGKQSTRSRFLKEDGSPALGTTRNMQSQQLPGSEPGRATPRRKKLKRPADQPGYEDPDDDDDDDGDGERHREGSSRKARAARPSTAIRGVLGEFFEQQLRLDVQRQEMVERRAQERMFFEQQWRQSMQRIEQERLVLEQAWVQREEQRRMREEARAERRDALLTSLLTRLLQGDL
ncbi:hypothetical protein U9M48_022278 [Paspalum notatum var. saurae]|uniref:Uncharacterized protein n=1 Tax=Paspalum notatum var. saurae TaxID=547442 RepID=A0AAQ3WUL5_PASNO